MSLAITTLTNTIKKLKSINVRDFTFILDRGFCSTGNIDELNENKLSFIMGASSKLKPVKNLISTIHSEITDPNLMHIYDGKPIFAKQITLTIGGRKVDGYCFYNPQLEFSEQNTFYSGLNCAVEKLRSHKLRKGQKPSNIASRILEKYKSFVNWELNKKQFEVIIDRDSVIQKINRMGKFILLYNGNFTWEECLAFYRGKDIIEKCFKVLKSDLETMTPNVRTDETLKGLLFVCFISLLLRMRLTRIMQTSKLSEKYSIDSLLLELEKIRLIELSDANTIKTEITKSQKDVLNKLNLCA